MMLDIAQEYEVWRILTLCLVSLQTSFEILRVSWCLSINRSRGCVVVQYLMLAAGASGSPHRHCAT
jgi:hypothetical protein